jgi:hypothetical protein
LSTTTSFLAIALALGFATLSTGAVAQIAKDESVLRRVGGKDYAADGIQLGSFTVSPKVEIGAQYDDNVFRTKHDRKDDISYHIAPSLSIIGDFDTVTVSLGASADFGRFVQYSGENYESFTTSAGLSYAISDDWNWSVAGTMGHGLQRRGLDTDDSSNKASTYWFYTAESSLTYQGDPFAFRFSPVYRRYNFNDSGGVNNDDRDRQEYELGGRFAYKVGANTSVFFDPTYIWVRYDSRLDDFGHNRNSNGYDLRVGAGYDVSELLYIEAGIGYFHRNFQDHAFKSESGISALARLYWNPTDTLSVEAAVSRGVTESDAFVNSSINSGTAVTTGAQLRVGWLAADNILFDTGVSWYNFDYNVLSRKDNFYLFDIGGKYYLNRNIYTGLRYFYERRTSSDSSLEYSDNRVMIFIGGQL